MTFSGKEKWFEGFKTFIKKMKFELHNQEENFFLFKGVHIKLFKMYIRSTGFNSSKTNNTSFPAACKAFLTTLQGRATLGT